MLTCFAPNSCLITTSSICADREASFDKAYDDLMLLGVQDSAVSAESFGPSSLVRKIAANAPLPFNRAIESLETRYKRFKRS